MTNRLPIPEVVYAPDLVNLVFLWMNMHTHFPWSWSKMILPSQSRAPASSDFRITLPPRAHDSLVRRMVVILIIICLIFGPLPLVLLSN